MTRRVLTCCEPGRLALRCGDGHVSVLSEDVAVPALSLVAAWFMLQGIPVNPTLLPRVLAFAAVVFWGVSFVATKAALRELAPVTLIFARFGVGTALLFFLFPLLGERARVRGFFLAYTRRTGTTNPSGNRLAISATLADKSAAPILPPKTTWGPLLLMGFSGVFVHQMLQAYGLCLTTAIHTGWLIGLIPAWSAILAAALGRERLGGRKRIGLLAGFAGATLIISRGRLGPGTFQLPTTRGDFLILASTINWALYSLLAQGTVKRLGSTTATAWSMFLGWLLIIPFFAAGQGWRELPGLSATGWGAVLFLGIGCSGLGYLFWYYALERIPVSQVAAFLYIEPLVTLVTAMILLNEQVTLPAMLGGLIVLASVYVMQKG